MIVDCFECGVEIESENLDAIIDNFVAHGQQVHSWSYPEEAVRNYARNYAEAAERLSGNTERLSEIGDIKIHQVDNSRIEDWLRFFDHDGFAGNPSWASCYCLEPHVPATPEQPERVWREARAAVVKRISIGATYGYLAYVDNQVAGWVNASLRSDYGLFRFIDPDGPGHYSVIGVSCFVVAPPFRRHGVASALLDHVIAAAPSRGASLIEGYPHNKPDESAAGHFRGLRSMYEARGFLPVEVRDDYTVMRRLVD